MQKEVAKPFIKWAGGKGQLLSKLDTLFPQELINGSIDIYLEPFIGGGATLFHILQTYNIQTAYINDINKELINCYLCIQKNVGNVILILQELEYEYLGAKNRNDYYYKIRNKYNEICLNGLHDFEKCADFIFLNKTCFNGLYRVNKAGKFNVPHGRYKNPKICDSSNLKLCSQLLQKVKIYSGNYQNVLKYADKNAFIYLDPPYRPLLESNSFNNYDKSGFNDIDQKKLANNFYALDSKHCLLMLSNSDPKNIDENDNFFDNLYKKFKIERINARRMINCQADKRGEITEIVVMNY